MATYTQENDIVGGGGFGYGGGMFAMIILLVVVFWVLFRGRDGERGEGHGYGYGLGNGCGICVQPTFKDESNYEEERNINAKLCKIDEHVWKTACETKEVVHCEAEKTREQETARYIQALRDKNTEKDMIIQTMKSEAFTAAQIGMVNNKIEKVDEMIERLACELPKRPPVWSECVTPCAVELPERCSPRRRRERFEDECFA